jgi:hypothetical protein
MGSEYICLKQFFYFCQRHRRYAMIFLVMYATSLRRWRKTRPIRTAYCFVQLMDDIVDGDRHFDGDPGFFVNSIIEELRNGQFSHENDASKLVAQFCQDISSRPDASTLNKKLIGLLETLRVDFERRINHLTLPRATLDRHHRTTFELSLDITLALADSETRASHAPGLVKSLVWCSVMRDLREDLAAGIINIPQEVLILPGHVLKRADIDSILSHEGVREWIRTEYSVSQKDLQAAKEDIDRIDERTGKRIATVFWKGISAYVPKYERCNRSILSPS